MRQSYTQCRDCVAANAPVDWSKADCGHVVRIEQVPYEVPPAIPLKKLSLCAGCGGDGRDSGLCAPCHRKYFSGHGHGSFR